MNDGATVSTAELEIARQAALAGAEVVTRCFHEGVSMHRKGAVDLVSEADIESERSIAEVIRAAFPHHAILGEESHHGDDPAAAEHLWVVDPLDGTTNFAHGIPHFAISIAYYREGRAECGVVHNPIRGDWFVTARGRGALHDGNAVRVAETDRLDETLLGVGFYYDRGAMMEATLAAIRDLFGHDIHGIRRFGTASLDLCQVGEGRFGAFFEYELAPWDFAAGRLFVEEAGGRVTTCTGDALPLASSTVLASNGLLHEAVLRIVRPHWPA